jgi:hypothetical protein
MHCSREMFGAIAAAFAKAAGSCESGEVPDCHHSFAAHAKATGRSAPPPYRAGWRSCAEPDRARICLRDGNTWLPKRSRSWVGGRLSGRPRGLMVPDARFLMTSTWSSEPGLPGVRA